MSQMRRTRRTWRISVAMAGVLAGLGWAQNAPKPAPTFNADVAAILHRHCASCHRPNQVAPMSLISFDDARPWARAIKARVAAREMPPWHADPRYGEFRNALALTGAEIGTLVDWVDGGAPEGDGTPPAPPVFHDGWSTEMGRPPDQIVEAPFEFSVPAQGEVPTFTVWLKVPFKNDTFLEALELRPSNPRVVHHSGVSLGMLPPRTKIGRAQAWEGGPVLEGMAVFNDGRPFRSMSGDDFGYPLLFYVPGGGFLRFPQGIAKRLRAGQYFSWGMHYVSTGHAETNRMRLGLWLSRKRVTHEAVTMTVNERTFVNGREVPRDPQGRSRLPNIPANADNWEVTGTLSFRDAATLYALWPHMHYRGRDMTFVLRDVKGREEPLLSVPGYNPNWQVTYDLVKPLRIPARSTIIATAHYDNSSRNRYNPAPAQEVTWGPQGSNEMFLPFLEVSIDKDDVRFEDLIEPIR
jgi:mono/diheme cytochrome c family protein